VAQDDTGAIVDELGCPDAELLAEYIDGIRSSRVADIEPHLVACGVCRSIVADTTGFGHGRTLDVVGRPCTARVTAWVRRWRIRAIIGTTGATATADPRVVRSAVPSGATKPNRARPEPAESEGAMDALVAALRQRPAADRTRRADRSRSIPRH